MHLNTYLKYEPVPATPKAKAQRKMDTRLVRSVEAILKQPLNLKKKADWTSLVQRLRNFTEADWAALKAHKMAFLFPATESEKETS